MGPPNSSAAALESDEGGGAPALGPTVEVTDRSGGVLDEGALRWLRDRAPVAAARVARHGDVRAALVGDAEMAAAHRRHCGIDHTTDVLTFDLSDAPAGPAADLDRPSPRVLDADLLLCADEAVRQARARGHATERELLLYFVHGLLHCLGHDDHDPGRASAMHGVEDRVLIALGVGATYTRGTRGDPP